MVELQSTAAEASPLSSLLSAPVAGGFVGAGCARPQDRGTLPERVRREAAHDQPLPPQVNSGAAHDDRQTRSIRDSLVDEDWQAQKDIDFDGRECDPAQA